MTLPRIEVRIEMDDRQRPELSARSAQKRQGDGVIAAEGKNVTAGS
jgi:hypothetical protein